MSDTESRPNPALTQAAFEPIAVYERKDGSFCVFARTPDGTIEIAPLIAVVDSPKARKRLLECPCCGHPFILTEYADGPTILTPFNRDDA